MIPDGFQHFSDDFWNFQFFHQIWPRAPRIYHQNTLKNIRKYGIILKQYYFSYLNILEIQNFQIFDPTGHHKCVTYFYCFSQNMVGPKQLASPSVFEEFSVGNLDEILEIGKA